MKLFTKSLIAVASFGLATAAMAADPIVGKWKTPEKGTIVTISQSGSKFSGKIANGKYAGRTALIGVASQGSGKYKGKAKHPKWGFSVGAKITVSGSTLKIKTIKGTQTWKKQ